MSSIYRKGRDGYFYYQTYILNKETGKKDKKIFHSLGTKDENLARQKQVDLDKKYSKNLSKNEAISKTKKYIREKVILIIFSFFGISFFINHFLKEEINPKPENKNVEDSSSFLGSDSFSTNENIIANRSEPLKPTAKKVKEVNSMLPKYNIRRVIDLARGFKQAKFFVTVAENSTKDQMLQICQKITEDYSSYLNIVICLYSDTDIGIAIANDEKVTLDSNEESNAWLAMYTYNDVEGVFFDDRPTSFFGGY